MSEPGEKLYALVSVQHPKLGTNFTASLTAKRVIPSNIQDHDAFFWLLPHKVSFVTYWNVSIFIYIYIYDDDDDNMFMSLFIYMYIYDGVCVCVIIYCIGCGALVEECSFS